MGEQAAHPKDAMNGDEPVDEEEMSDEEDSDDEDISPEEFEVLNSKMDEINTALDQIENQNDDIYSKLLVLLQENKEIREQMQGTRTSQNGEENNSAN